MGQLRRAAWLLASLLLLCSIPTRLSIAQAQPTSPRLPSATPARVVGRESLDMFPKLPDGDRLVSVLVKLDVAPLASYGGGLPGLDPTSPASTGAPALDPTTPASLRYLAYLDQRLGDFEAALQAAAPQARVTARYRYVFGGVALALPDRQVARLAGLPGVVQVQYDRLRQPATDRSPQFIGADVIWQALAADPRLGDGGQGVVVGVIDTGIWPEHPSFTDDGSYPPPEHWRGACELPRDDSAPIPCTNKLIGARALLATYKLLIGLEPDEFDSPRDDDGHGTHTASTAAGNAGVSASIFGQPRGVISGIAPRAYVAAYKALGAAGGFSSDLVAAIERAVADGVDVINYSIGSPSAASPYQEADALAFLDAYAARVFVAVSAGNAGPDPGTVGSPANAPWVMSVAASTTDRRFISQLTLQSGGAQLVVDGASITAGVVDKPVLNAATLGDERCEHPLPASVAGTIVICQRGVNARIAKGANVAAGGGAGMILYNPTVQDVETDNHWVPTIHLDAPEGQQVLAFTSTHSATGVLGTISTSLPVIQPSFGDVMAAFSSRGPLELSQLGISKPDVTAPGVQILAGNTPEPSQASGFPPGELFQAIAGTSMSSPHVAGAGALLKALHPLWTPGQIKSALMTTARTQVVKEDGVTPADPYDMGSGRIDLTRAGDPGLTFDVAPAAYALGRQHLEQLNYPSISLPALPGRMTVTRAVRSTLTTTATWTLSAEAPPGVSIKAEPSIFTLLPGVEIGLVIVIDASAVPEGAYFARLLLQSDQRSLHIPISFNRRDPTVEFEKQCDPASIPLGSSTACTLTATNTGSADATVAIRDVMPPELPIQPDSVVGATLVSGTNTLVFAGQIPGVAPPQIEITPDPSGPGYISLASLGVPPMACTDACDETSIVLVAPEFPFGGQTYDRVTMVTNGYLGLGSGTTIRVTNQKFPDPEEPNNVIAPYWTDLDLDGASASDSGGGTWTAAYVTFGANSPTWFVAEWTDVARYTADPALSSHTFQVWIEGGSGRIYMVYGPNSATEEPLTVGAENADGSSGVNVYVDLTSGDGPNGTGVVPVEGDQLAVTTSADQVSSHIISYQALGTVAGAYTTSAELRVVGLSGTSVATTTVTVLP